MIINFVLQLIAVALNRVVLCPWCGMGWWGPWGWSPWFGPFGFIWWLFGIAFMVLFLVLLVLFIVWLLRKMGFTTK